MLFEIAIITDYSSDVIFGIDLLFFNSDSNLSFFTFDKSQNKYSRIPVKLL